ncbi:MAG: hypothetical protein KBC26_00715 [Candidatus Pacebacteria bacterium]|nr:hypothetical protein [Candidatus Paceibacterota bacterium]
MTQTRGGAIALSVILIVGVIVVEIAAASMLISYFANQEGFGTRLAIIAATSARVGVDEALRRIVRGDYASAGGSFSVSLAGNASAGVTVCKDLKTVTSACDTANGGLYEITSIGSAVTKKSKLRAYVVVDTLTGRMTIESSQYSAVE